MSHRDLKRARPSIQRTRSGPTPTRAARFCWGAVLLLLHLSGCSAPSVAVRDESGRPIPGARVVGGLPSFAMERVTDDEGLVWFGSWNIDSVSVSKPGYESVFQSVYPAGPRPHEVVLLRAKAAREESPRGE